MKYSIRAHFIVEVPPDSEPSDAHAVVEKIINAGLKKKKRSAEKIVQQGILPGETKEIKQIKPASS